MLDDAIKPAPAVAASVLLWPTDAMSLHLWEQYRGETKLSGMKPMDLKRADDKMPVYSTIFELAATINGLSHREMLGFLKPPGFIDGLMNMAAHFTFDKHLIQKKLRLYRIYDYCNYHFICSLMKSPTHPMQ